MDKKNILNRLLDRNDLSQKEAGLLLEQIILGELNPIQVGAVLTALRTKGETVEEITGFIKIMRKHMVKIDAKSAIDIVGTGGDGSGTFNISTAASFVVAGLGVPVAKHGNRAASSKCGSADVLEALGVNINLKPNQAEAVFKKAGIVFLFAPLFHPAMKQIAPVRKKLGLRTIFNFLGPFLNPAQTKKQLLGVPNPKLAKKLALVAVKLKFDHLLLVAGQDSMDEVTTTGTSIIYEIKKSSVKSYRILPERFKIKLTNKNKLSGGNANENALIIRNILNGEKGPKRDIILLNSAAVFYLAGRAKNIEDGIKLAERSIDNGLAMNALKNLIKETQKYV